MVEQFLANLHIHLGEKKLITWRERPCIDDFQMVDEHPFGTKKSHTLTWIYCRLTAY
jgi:hypothetical protein